LINRHTSIPQDPTKLRYGCGAATAAQINRVSSDLAALEPKVTAAAAQASSLQATFVQGSNQTAALRAQVDELKATIAALTAAVQKLQANAANATVPGTITQQLAALTAADMRTAQQLALLEAANQTVARDITALKSAPQQCFCGLELSAVNTTLAAIIAAQAADATSVSLANATVASLKATVTASAADIASVNTTLTALAANVANVSAIDFSVYAKTADLANINAVSLGGVPAAQFLRLRVVLYRESLTTTRKGNLGGRPGADALCSASPNRPTGLVQVRAFLSISASDQIADFVTNYGVPNGLAIESPSGAVLARNFTGLMGGSIMISLRNAGLFTGNSFWWSGSGSNGVVAAQTCNGFTSEAVVDVALNGFAGATDGQWLAAAVGSCAALRFFLCIAY
jgi:hypothetical protein